MYCLPYFDSNSQELSFFTNLFAYLSRQVRLTVSFFPKKSDIKNCSVYFYMKQFFSASLIECYLMKVK
jgi:hypothetical protein